MDFEEILNKVGNYGKYQRRLFYLMLLPYSFLASWFHILPYFMISSPDHWCKVPVLEKFSQATQSQIIRPIETDVYGRNKSSNCQMWDLDYESLLKNQFNSFSTSFHESNETSIIEFFKPYLKHVVATRPCNQGWVFDKSDYDETLVTNVSSLKVFTIFLFVNSLHQLHFMIFFYKIKGKLSMRSFAHDQPCDVCWWSWCCYWNSSVWSIIGCVSIVFFS